MCIRDRDGRVADVVVHVLQARVHRAVVHRGQKRHVVAGALEDGHQKLEVVGGHLGRQNRPALIAHLLGELGARELGGGALALDVYKRQVPSSSSTYMAPTGQFATQAGSMQWLQASDRWKTPGLEPFSLTKLLTRRKNAPSGR